MFKSILKISLDIKCLILQICIEKRLLFILILYTLPFGFICIGDTMRKGCRVYTSSNVHIADCSLLEMSVNVPNDLDPGIEVMNLSGNHLANINDKSFERYKENLVALDLSNMSPLNILGNTKITYDDRSFSGLRKLEYLDISRSCIVRHKFRFPSSLKTLKMDNCELTSLNFSHIRALEELHAAECNLIDLPIIHKQTPLKYLDLRRNNLVKLRVETLAPFCQLKRLRLQIPESEGLHDPKTYCQCKTLESWLTNTGVDHEQLNCTKAKKDKKKNPLMNVASELDDFDDSHVISGFSVNKKETENFTVNIHPSSDSKNKENCSSAPSETALQLRQECLTKSSANDVSAVKTNWLMIGVIVFAVFALLIPSFVYSRIRIANKRKKKKIHDLAAHEEEYEEEAEEEVYHH